jgi:hypothetical protein
MLPPPAWLVLPAVFLAGFLLSVVLEKLAKPGAPGLSRSFPALMLHAGLWGAALAIPLAITGRPFFSSLLCLSGELLVILINNAKYRALREPFIFSDFGIFSQTVKHPRLYLPFLGIGRTLAIIAAVAATFAVGWWLEPPVENSSTSAAALLAAGAALAGIGWLLGRPLSLNPAADVTQQGLFTSIAHYWILEKTSAPARKTDFPSVGKPRKTNPDVVVIQSESFFDPRRAFPCVRRDLLRNFDAACASATLHGQLTVPAWGANTMRPEFGFLSGMRPGCMGIHQFNPYRVAAARPVRALPAVLREAGYTTTCIHPHPARFFRRDRAFPNLGFQRFADIREFRGAKKQGPYISDEAVTDKLIEELATADQPAFFFAITMENHGPLHLEKTTDGETAEFYEDPPHTACSDLGVYLRHLRNADRQLARLREFLRSRSRPYVFVFYGEHLPSMPVVYGSLGTPDGRTDYFIESSVRTVTRKEDLAVEEMGRRLLQVVEAIRQ